MNHNWFVPKGWAGRLCSVCSQPEFNGTGFIKSGCGQQPIYSKSTFYDMDSETSAKVEDLIATAEKELTKKKLPIKKDQLEAIVRGALKDTIYSHGPITAKYISSASKRITGSIIGLLEKYYAMETSESIDKP